MRQQGRLMEWNDDRGFGFVTPLGGGARVFAHVSEFPRDKRRPVAMDLVTYAVDHDERGRLRAKDVLFLTPTGPAKRLQKRPERSSFIPIALAVLALLFGVAAVLVQSCGSGQFTDQRTTESPVTTSSDRVIADAFQNQRSGVQVTGEGIVTRVLSDDNEGSRHQRFILRLASGQTLLFAHNIDIAPRLDSLASGDSVAFNGEYEWNAEGGVVHWTHHDPDGQHAPGWLKHNGVVSQ